MKKILLISIVGINALALFLPNIHLYSIVLSIAIPLILLIRLRNRKSEVDEMIEEDTPLSTELPKVSLEEDHDSIEENVPNLDPYLEKVYYIKECMPIIETFSRNTRCFEEKTLQGLFQEFETIWAESDEIVRDSESSMKSIFDPGIGDNLGYVLNASKEINSDFTNFMPVLKLMSNLTDKFINTSIESFNTVTKTTRDIVDLAEQVKVISINVRIEAARVQDSGGFKVLGNDISNFAERTSRVALNTNDQIKETMEQINNLKLELTSQLSRVESLAESIFVKVNPFERILGSSSDSVMDVIKNLNKISEDLQHNIKDSMSRMQYQDITNQESEHILKILKKIEATNPIGNELLENLSDDLKKEVHKDIIAYLRSISTTVHEEEEIVKLSKHWDIKLGPEAVVPGVESEDGVFFF